MLKIYRTVIYSKKKNQGINYCAPELVAIIYTIIESTIIEDYIFLSYHIL